MRKASKVVEVGIHLKNQLRRAGGGTPSATPAVATKAGPDEPLIVAPDSAVKEGWMYKRGGSQGGRTNWKRRWFMLIGSELYYMEGKDSAEPLGRIALADREFRRADEEVKKPCALAIYNRHDLKETPFFVHTDTDEELTNWLEALQAAADGQNELKSGGVAPEVALMQIARLAREYEPRHLLQAELEVAVLEAKGIAAMDSNGLSDPYCVVQCGAVKCHTRCIQKTLVPRWEETFRFQVSKKSEQLQLDMYDRDMIGDDDYLGQVMLPLKMLLHEATRDMAQDAWHPLQPRTAKDTHVTGEVRLRIVARPPAGMGVGVGGQQMLIGGGKDRTTSSSSAERHSQHSQHGASNKEEPLSLSRREVARGAAPRRRRCRWAATRPASRAWRAAGLGLGRSRRSVRAARRS